MPLVGDDPQLELRLIDVKRVGITHERQISRQLLICLAAADLQAQL